MINIKEERVKIEDIIQGMMIKELNQDWLLREEPLSCDKNQAAAVMGRESGWYETDLPADVRQPLIREGVIEEPLEKLNCYDSEWIENRSWWFRKSFVMDELSPGGPIRLVLDYLDIFGDIFLNGAYLGCHKSVHYPFVQDVRSYLREGENLLLIRVTTGLERVGAELPDDGVCTEKSGNRGDRGDFRRNQLRKPQYVFGWDWGPRVATVGLGEARLELCGGQEVGGCSIHTASVDRDRAELKLEYQVVHHDPLTTGEAYIGLTIRDPRGQEVFREHREHFLTSGRNFFDMTLGLDKPELWWPRGYGEQPLYTLVVTCGEGRKETRFGIRTLRLNTDKIAAKDAGSRDRLFAIEINGAKIFARGANWIPADSIWQRVTGEKYRSLVEEAAEMNFTMLRVWGGGIYERECFYDACDELGVMVWQDFMFGCALVPDDKESFRELVNHEVNYQIERLRNHPSLVLWCGNNENQWIFRETTGYLGGTQLYNEMIPRAVRRLSAHIPYWNSSPFGGEEPNSTAAGDCHYWHQAQMNGNMERRIDPFVYDESDHKFISEYGYIGPCPRESLERIFAGEPIHRDGDIWNHHNNTFEKETVNAGIDKHYVPAENLSLDEYIHYAGLVQGLMYSYSLESFRFKENCWGGLFWMFNDTWGETGWTVIDYYGHRKISFPFIRRALKPVKLILRETDGQVNVVLCNDQGRELKGELEYGWVSPDGSSSDSEVRPIVMGPRSQGNVLCFDKPGGEPEERIVYCRLKGESEDRATLWEAPLRSQHPEPATLTVVELERSGTRVVLSVTADRYAHAVHFGLGQAVRPSEEYFDLLPGETARVVLEGEGIPGLEEIRRRAGDFTAV